jgi:hypothetical protein
VNATKRRARAKAKHRHNRANGRDDHGLILNSSIVAAGNRRFLNEFGGVPTDVLDSWSDAEVADEVERQLYPRRAS